MTEKEMALNEAVEVENNEGVTPIPETQATEEAVEVKSEPAGDEEAAPEETEKVQKKGYSNRVRELNNRAKEAEVEVRTLETRIKELTSSPEPSTEYRPQQKDDGPIVKPGEEIDAVELSRRLEKREQRVLQRADALASLRAKQQGAVTRIQGETAKVIRTYPELDPESDSFNKELSEAISEATEAYVMKSPYSASVTSFVDKMMRPYKGAVSKEVGEMTSSVAKQVSQAATRPTSVRKKERPAKEKTIAELEAELGIVQA